MRFSRQLAGCASPKVYSQSISDGDAGVAQTIALMSGLVYRARLSPEVRRAALDAVRGTERGMDEMAAVLGWIKENIEFRGEYGETLQEPRLTLEWRAGDCDDQSTLAAAMLQALGYATRFKTVALVDSPDELSHVYVEVQDKRSGQWISLDPTVARSWPGWQPDNIARGIDYAPMEPSPSPLIEGLIAIGATIGAIALFGK